MAQGLDVTPAKTSAKVTPHGKFFRRFGQKFFFKAMRFAQPGDSFDLTRKLALRQRFEELSRGHTTGLILAEYQAEALLGIAAQAGLQVMVELPVTVGEVSSDRGLRDRVARIVKSVELWRGEPALAGYLIDCPIDPVTLRHRGLRQVQNRLGKVIQAIRGSDAACLVALKHRPATVGLALLDEDLIYADMPALAPAELRAYVVRLHNLAEARPVVLEFGEGLPGRDEVVACAFGLGAAGVVAPAMPPAASPGSLGMRVLSAGELLPFVTLNGSCPPQPVATPMVSVVICAYNAERTMRDCLESLRKLDYPNYEVVIVDDGSRDSTAQISADFPEFRLIRQPNKGLSVARNVGAHAANGEIVAYTDSDCVVDPHWLTLMVRAMAENAFDGCGGPNYAPHETGWVEGCVAASPGAPCHVLVGDDRAEHLAGCNMIFRKAALLELGGFDPQFTAAGDDVDICWRMLDAGFTLGFCPSAFVWHFRRNTVKAYYGQQRGYGKAEAMLFPKYPERFNALGQIRWRGTIPGIARTYPGGALNRVGWTHRTDELQAVADAPLSVAKVLPLTAEWNAGCVVALALSLGSGITILPALAMLALGPVWALYYAWQAPLEKCHNGFVARMLIAWLAYTGPISRTIARYRYRRNNRGSGQLETAARQRPTLDWHNRSIRLAYWSESWIPRDGLLERIARHHAVVGRPTTVEQGWRDADLALEPGALTRVEIKTADEEHSGGRLKNHVAIRARLAGLTRAGLALSVGAAAGAAILGDGAAAAAFGIVAAGLMVCAASEVLETVRRAYRVVEQSASELGLVPLGIPTRAARRAVQPQPTPVKAPDASLSSANEPAMNS
ncbi:MAG: glycosyltransferase [Candidatus Binataceae bacterium]